MSNNTKNAKQMYVSDDFFRSDDILKLGRTLNIPKAEKPLNEKFTALVDEVQTLYDENEWIQIENKDVYFNKSENIIFPNLKTTRMAYGNQAFNDTFAGFKGKIITENQARNLFITKRSQNPFFIDNDHYTNGNLETPIFVRCQKNNGKFACMNITNNGEFHTERSNNNDGCTDGNCGAKIAVFNLTSRNLFENMRKYDLVPKNLSPEGKETLRTVKSLVPAGYISIEQNKIKVLKLLADAIINNNNIPESIKDVLKEPFSDDNMAQYMKEYVYDNIIELTDERLKFIGKPLLECDQYRAKIEPYDLKCLTDPNGGHWELWSDNEPENKTRIEFDKPLVGRNPKIDIHWDGLVGIDFGTKSTIVAYQNGTDKTYLHRVGIGELSKKATAEQYENPTIMEFIDFENFMDCYESSLGRPETKWNDIVVSHEAQGDLNSSGRSENFYSYFYNLKQWCADTTSGN